MGQRWYESKWIGTQIAFWTEGLCLWFFVRASFARNNIVYKSSFYWKTWDAKWKWLCHKNDLEFLWEDCRDYHIACRLLPHASYFQFAENVEKLMQTLKLSVEHSCMVKRMKSRGQQKWGKNMYTFFICHVYKETEKKTPKTKNVDAFYFTIWPSLKFWNDLRRHFLVIWTRVFLLLKWRYFFRISYLTTSFGRFLGSLTLMALQVSEVERH